MILDGQTAGLAAVRFFSLPPDDQCRVLRKLRSSNAEQIFRHKRIPDQIGELAFGLACVIKTYKGQLYEMSPIGDEQMSAIGELSRWLDAPMSDDAFWTESALESVSAWQVLRCSATKVLHELNQSPEGDIPDIVIVEQIDPDEFQTSPEVLRQLLE